MAWNQHKLLWKIREDQEKTSDDADAADPGKLLGSVESTLNGTFEVSHENIGRELPVPGSKLN